MFRHCEYDTPAQQSWAREKELERYTAHFKFFSHTHHSNDSNENKNKNVKKRIKAHLAAGAKDQPVLFCSQNSLWFVCMCLRNEKIKSGFHKKVMMINDDVSNLCCEGRTAVCPVCMFVVLLAFCLFLFPQMPAKCSFIFANYVCLFPWCRVSVFREPMPICCFRFDAVVVWFVIKLCILYALSFSLWWTIRTTIFVGWCAPIRCRYYRYGLQSFNWFMCIGSVLRS